LKESSHLSCSRTGKNLFLFNNVQVPGIPVDSETIPFHVFLSANCS